MKAEVAPAVITASDEAVNWFAHAGSKARVLKTVTSKSAGRKRATGGFQRTKRM